MNGRSIFWVSRRRVTAILNRFGARHGRDLNPACKSWMLTATLLAVPHHPSDDDENSLMMLSRLMVLPTTNVGGASPCGQCPAISVAIVLQNINASGYPTRSATSSETRLSEVYIGEI